MKEITCDELRRRLASGDTLLLVDVREPYEHEAYAIGGINIPITELPFRLAELEHPIDDEIVLYCQSGNRSSLAQKLLSTQFNKSNTINLIGGMNAWKEIET